MLLNLYSLLTLLGSVLIAPFFLIHPRGKHRLAERYGNWLLPAKEYLWFHGASVGEMRGLMPIIRAVREQQPSAPILITATSPTGLELARDLASEVRLLPFDSTLWLRRALRGIRVRKFILAETELWPALIHELSQRKVPLVLVNGRISDFSFQTYWRLRSFLRVFLNCFRHILVVDEQAQSRFVELGADVARVKVAGNTKYDRIPTVCSPAQLFQQKCRFFPGDCPVITLGSIRPGEEAPWLSTFVKLRNGGHTLSLVIAPRHLERLDYFKAQLNSHAIEYRCMSSEVSAPFSCHTLLLDTMGQLELAYSFSDLAFVGGSLVSVGGHNPLEPAMYGVPVVMGPSYSNVEEVVQHLRAHDAISIVHDGAEVEELVLRFLANREQFRDAGSRAHTAWKEMTGATKRVLEVLENV